MQWQKAETATFFEEERAEVDRYEEGLRTTMS